ncbi:hypothetical protein CDD83_10620 [Cordyceps sp. RAO-2017]|nr:hypothetical protein CDD83_10620 [Cordyceps sp. RAO-2017]
MRSVGFIGLALASAGAAETASQHPAAACCKTLSYSIPYIYHSPVSPEYNSLIKARWSNTAILHPGCVITPRSAQDVSKALKILAKQHCQFAVKAGGHSATPGFNSIDGGVSIDLTELKSTYMAPDRSSVTLGSGVTWGLAYDTFNDSNIGFTGGVCEDVGVGGVSIGGGQSLFQAKLGWAVDNIIDYEVVLASGKIVHANQRQHRDLFRALKGGNTNFGIVTRVQLAAFELDNLWGGEVFVGLNGPQASRPEMLDKLSRAIVDFVAKNNDDVDTGLQILTAYLSGGKGQTVNSALSNTRGVENPETVRPFLDMPNRLSNNVRHVKIADFVHELSSFVPKGFRQITASLTITNDYKTLREVWEATDAVYDALPQKDKIDWVVSIIPQPKVQQSYAKKRGGNSLGLSHVKEDQIVFWFSPRWTDPALDSVMEEVRDKFVEVGERVAKKHGTYSPFLYINFASPQQDPLCGYGADSVAFLKRTARKYDPKGVFQKLMPGGFKVSKAHCSRRKHSY